MLVLSTRAPDYSKTGPRECFRYTSGDATVTYFIRDKKYVEYLRYSVATTVTSDATDSSSGTGGEMARLLIENIVLTSEKFVNKLALGRS